MDRPASGAFDLPSGDEDLGRVGYQLHAQLAEFHKLERIERLFYEAPLAPSQMIGRTQLHVTAKVFCIASHIESFCYAKNIRCRLVGMGAWRRYFVGKGAGEKTAIFKSWARDRCAQLGWNVRSHDEADACGILAYGISLDPSLDPPWRDALTFAAQFQPKKKAVRS